MYTCIIAIPVIGGINRSPDLQVNTLRSTTASRVDVPSDDEAVTSHLLCRVDDQNRFLGAILVLTPRSFIAQLLQAPAYIAQYIYGNSDYV